MSPVEITPMPALTVEQADAIREAAEAYATEVGRAMATSTTYDHQHQQAFYDVLNALTDFRP